MPKWVSTIGLLVPPDGEDGYAITRWRWFVFIAIVVIGLVLAGHILMIKGIVPGHAFAFQSELQEVQKNVDTLAESLKLANSSSLDAQIFEIRESQCRAILSENGQAVSMAELRIRRRIQEWEAITNRTYRRPSCEEVGVLR